jgi:Sulfotransferase family
MIISHSHRFIFVKSLKTAGTSIEAALSHSCSGNDIVTPLGPYEFNRDESGAWVHQSMNEGSYQQHDDAKTIRDSLPPETWSSYFKFSITRNPWDRALSFFFWDRRQDSTLVPQKRLYHSLGVPLDDFTPVKQKFVAFIKCRTLESNDAFYVMDDQLCTDFVIRYEHLDEDCQEVCKRTGLPPFQIPRLKTGIRKDKRHYSEYFDDEAREIVADLHRNDIRFFNYRFGQ